MAKVYKPPFGQTNKTLTGVITTVIGGIGTDSVTNTVLICTAGADGAVVSAITVMPRSTVTNSSICLFLSKDNGVTQRMIDSELLPSYTLTAATAIPETVFGNISEETPLRLEAGDKLYVGTQNAIAAGAVAACKWMDL